MSRKVFEWYKDIAGNFRFRVKAANGEIIAVSGAYKSKEELFRAIEDFRINIPNAQTKEITLQEVAKDVRTIKESQFRQEKQSNIYFIVGVLLGGLIGVIGNFFVSYLVMNPQSILGLAVSGGLLIIMFIALILLTLKYIRKR